jgi:hypothetical protein
MSLCRPSFIHSRNTTRRMICVSWENQQQARVCPVLCFVRFLIDSFIILTYGDPVFQVFIEFIGKFAKVMLKLAQFVVLMNLSDILINFVDSLLNWTCFRCESFLTNHSSTDFRTCSVRLTQLARLHGVV